MQQLSIEQIDHVSGGARAEVCLAVDMAIGAMVAASANPALAPFGALVGAAVHFGLHN